MSIIWKNKGREWMGYFGAEWAECPLIIETGCWVQFLLAAGDSVPKILVQILHSAEVDYSSPFDLKIACLCQSIEINNNKHVYRQSQLRKPNGSGVEWAECSLIIGTGCWVQVFLAWSSIAQSICQRAFSLLEIQFHRPCSNPALSRGRQLVSYRFDNCLPVPEIYNNNNKIYIYICMYVYIHMYVYVCIYNIHIYSVYVAEVVSILPRECSTQCCGAFSR